MGLLFRIASIIATIALALWVGSMTGFAFLFAPDAFAHMGATANFAALIADSIAQLTRFGDGCAIVAALASILLLRKHQRSALAVLGCIVLMFVLSSYEVRSIVPQMQATQIGTSAYANLHDLSQRIYGSVLLLGILALGISSARKTV